jgi:hypothetical protein
MNVSWIIVRLERDKELPLWSTVSEQRQSAINDAIGRYGNPGDTWDVLKREGFRITRLSWAMDPSRLRRQ